MSIHCSVKKKWLAGLLLFGLYALTAPQNHSEAEDVYDFAQRVEQGSFADQAGVNRLLALPMFGTAFKAARLIGYSGRAFPFMIFINRLLAVVSLLLFYHLLASVLRPPSSVPILGTLLLAFSYGFWRYANEAETYMLASALLLGAWCLAIHSVSSTVSSADRSPSSVLRPLSAVLCPLVSALGILVHLLNLIPLLLIIPLYYLLSRDWKKAVLHGAVTGVLVALAYGISFHGLDWGELGAQHHREEAGIGLVNLLRGGMAFGQSIVSGNFLFGFESFRDLLVKLFPSRMLGEEFYMAEHMHAWIKWVGVGTLSALLGVGVWMLGCWVRCVSRQRTQSSQKDPTHQPPTTNRQPFRFRPLSPVLCPLTISSVVWLILYAAAVMHTESGSPELWILGLIPFWLLAARVLRGARAFLLVAVLLVHNWVAGLVPVLPAASDYHAEKGRWLVENCTETDLILTSYEPVMIFYLDYFSAAEVLNSGSMSSEEIQDRLGTAPGKVYALDTFFQPLESMRVRSPHLYGKMLATGQALFPRFGKITENDFGGIYGINAAENMDE